MFFRLGLLTVSLLSVQAILLGCGSNDVIKEDPVVAKQRMDAAMGLRSYFDKANGNFDALNADDKAAVIKMQGGEANARKAFSMMPKAPGAPNTPPPPANAPDPSKVNTK